MHRMDIHLTPTLEKEFRKFAELVKSRLIDEKYRAYCPADEDDLLEYDIPADGCGVYVIFLNNRPAYVGKSNSMRNRLRQHFIKKSDRTNSLLAQVEEHRKDIEFSYVLMGSLLRSSLEEYLIDEFKGNEPWWGKRK